MGIFWGQVAAQAISFIGFVIVLRIFAWGPVLRFLEQRRRKIKDELEKAEQKNLAAEKRHQVLEERLARIEAEERRRIQEAVAEGRKAAEQIAEAARAEAQRIRAHARQVAEIEFAKAMQQVKDNVVTMTLKATERLLRENMDGERQREMTRRFVEELSKN
ncbi:MAG: F0F1 ATP synthase subunit B [Candidatus Sumerlaeota bacterium]|nr:F0F1 ATP synthase subunit B [Candidatus Sumerlaeota bacterium]